MVKAVRVLCLWVLVGASGVARADGALVLDGRPLDRQGAATRNFCEVEDVECHNAILRALSGFSYLPGTLAAGARMQEDAGGGPQLQPSIQLRLSVLGMATPGAEADLGRAELAGWLAPDTLRLRGTFLDARSMFFCRDSQQGGLHAPFLGMTTRACTPGAVVGIELGVLEVQWDPLDSRVVAEWLRSGFTFELFGNGHAQDHLRRSLVLAPLVDLRSYRHDPDDPVADAQSRFGAGAGARLGLLLRSPRWEGRIAARYRVDLLELDTATPDQQLALELNLVHNFMLSDAIVSQVGLRLAMHHSARPREAFGMQASSTEPTSGFMGVTLGWKHEPPAI